MFSQGTAILVCFCAECRRAFSSFSATLSGGESLDFADKSKGWPLSSEIFNRNLYIEIHDELFIFLIRYGVFGSF